MSIVKVDAQIGNSIYAFLNLPVSARAAALGDSNVSLSDGDANFVFRNPATLNAETDKMLGLNMTNYVADITFGTGVYSFRYHNLMFATGMQFVNYGKFDGRDPIDAETGFFGAQDMALYLSCAYPLNRYFTVGATTKPIVSVYEAYTSWGLAWDAGVHFDDTAHLFSAGLVFRNAGFQFKGYYKDEQGQHYEKLPFEIELGISKKLTHAPFRFSLTLHDLQIWNLNYATTINKPSVDKNTAKKQPNFIDMAFRHAIIAVEFVPSKNFYLAASYNHRRFQELSMDGFKSVTGFSFGGGIKIYKFQAGFGLTQFQLGNYSYQFSLSTSLSEFGL
jgi:hypothetical protein